MRDRQYEEAAERAAAPTNPAHYAGDGEVDCQRAMRSMLFGARGKLSPMALFWWASALKYLWRWPWKNGAQDIDKAADCLRRLKAEAAR